MGTSMLTASTPSPPSPAPSCASFEAEAADTDMSGALIAEREAATSDDCCPLCQDAEGCEGYAFANKKCYLKGGFTGTYYNWGVVTRLASRIVRTGCSGFEDAQQDRDLAGKLLEDWYASSPDVCCAACTRKQDCGGFSFVNNKCYLKGDIQGTFEQQGALTRVKTGALPSTPAPSMPTTSMFTVSTPAPPSSTPSCASFEAEAADTDMSGALIAERKAATSDDCCPLCQEAEGCEGYAFANQICYLKGSFTGTYYSSGVVTRLVSRTVRPGCSDFDAEQQDTALIGK